METKVKIRDSVYILEDNENNYTFIFTATRRVKRFSVDGLVRDVVGLLDHEKEESELIERLSERHKRADVLSCLAALEKERIICRYQEGQIERRYANQVLFLDELTDSREESLSLQKKITGSTVAVFGTGGIGTWIVNGLYQIGIGEIRITDPDTVDETNLNRQLFFDSGDIGKYKVDVLKSKLRDANIVPFKKTVSEGEDLEEIVSGCDFLVNCADSPSVEDTSRIIDRYATKHNIPYCVAGGYNMHLGMIGQIIIPGKSVTFEQFIDYQKRNASLKDMTLVRKVEKSGNLGPIAGAVANIQVMEIFKYLTGKGRLNVNRFSEIDFLDLSITWRELDKIPI